MSVEQISMDRSKVRVWRCLVCGKTFESEPRVNKTTGQPRWPFSPCCKSSSEWVHDPAAML